MLNVIRAILGKPVKLSPKQEAKMEKAQARADAMIAEANAKLPAGTPPTMPSMRDIFKQSVENFRDSVGQAFDDRRNILDPGTADLNRPIPEAEDPQERDAIASAERAQRDAARAHFRAPVTPEIAFTRFATTGRNQLEDLVAALRATGLAAHPEHVYGVYRVPDRFDHKHGNEAKAYLEWEIAHRPGVLPAATDDVLTTAFRRDAHWVARNPGEPSVLDEDLPGLLAVRAALAPEDCFGLTRFLQIRGVSFDEGSRAGARIEGALLFTRPLPAVTEEHRALMAAAPFALQEPFELPHHVEILDWEAVAAWVAPFRWGPPRTPSPLPHLPSSWQELLLAYLQIVGVRSEDSYGVQVTRGKEGLLGDLSLASAGKNLARKPKLPCADGQSRELQHVAEQVVIAYRDRPEYEQGRGRWRAYQHEVLRARLDHLTGVRPPIEVNDNPRQSFLSEVFDMFNPLDPVQGFPQLFNRNQRPSLGPYCGTLP